MSNAAVLGDQLTGNIYYGSIIDCRFADRFTSNCGPIAFVGDRVRATGQVGDHVETHEGQITSGNVKYTADDGSPIAVVGESSWTAGPFSGVILGPGCVEVQSF